jgi:hypothetical protein
VDCWSFCISLTGGHRRGLDTPEGRCFEECLKSCGGEGETGNLTCEDRYKAWWAYESCMAREQGRSFWDRLRRRSCLDLCLDNIPPSVPNAEEVCRQLCDALEQLRQRPRPPGDLPGPLL